MRKLIVIPARLGSTRLKEKLLLKVNNIPIVCWTLNQALKTGFEVFVATDSVRIAQVVENFGGRAIMTSSTCENGTKRVAQAVEYLNLSNEDLVLNLQADEPLMDPELLKKLLFELEKQPENIVTAVTKFKDLEEMKNPNRVKVVFDNNNYAIYFSRSLIPYARNKRNYYPMLHLGLYGYSVKKLKYISKLPKVALEETESLEQLRWLFFGEKIKIVPTNYTSIAIDTKDDFEEFKKKFEK